MKSFRPERVGHLIREVVSEAITNRLNDPRIEPLSSVTRVEVSADLETARVWVSVMGSEPVQRRTLAGLKSATGFIQSLVAHDLATRTCPRLSFRLDESIKKGDETIRLIEQTMAEYGPKDSDTPAAPSDREEPGTEAESE